MSARTKPEISEAAKKERKQKATAIQNEFKDKTIDELIKLIDDTSPTQELFKTNVLRWLLQEKKEGRDGSGDIPYAALCKAPRERVRVGAVGLGSGTTDDNENDDEPATQEEKKSDEVRII